MIECKNFDELETLLGEYGVTITARIKRLHFESVKKAAAGIIESIEIFPQLRGQITSFEEYTNGTWILSSGYTGIVYFNANKFCKLMPTREKKLNNYINGRWFHPVNTGFAGTGAHEAGHMLIKDYIRKKYPNKSDDFCFQVWQNSSVANDILNEVAKSNNIKLYNLQKKMCRYAEKNASECIAECISDYVTNKNNACELSRYVAEFFKGV
jgi:hypothetical protein